MSKSYNKTIVACFTGYIVQAIVNNFIPLLFLRFQFEYGISLEKITLLVTFNFGIQLLVDLVSMTFVDRIGYRASMIIAHACAAFGIVSLTFLPGVFPEPFIGVLISVTIYAIGGGLLEVLVSPVVEACPTDNKEKTMSLLHSFYCWGHVGVVIIATVFFALAGIENWKVLSVFFALVPFVNMFVFMKVPMASLIEEGETGMNFKELFCSKIFWLLVVMMVCAGASEQAVSQWASVFAEKGLNLSKTMGDVAGPLTFAVMMGLARVFYGKYGEKINLRRFMIYSTVLCVASYLCISLISHPIVGFIGCGLAGFSVGIMWPGTFSIAAATLKRGGTAMFALLALAGDLGCGGGPTVVGFVSGALNDNLHMGILAGIVFPAVLLISLVFGVRRKQLGH